MLYTKLQIYVTTETWSKRIFDSEKFKFKIGIGVMKTKKITLFEIYVQSLKGEYMSDPKKYDEKISKNRERFLKQYVGKPFDIDKSISNEEIKKWIIDMRDKHGQELTDGFISYYIFYNMSIPITEDGKFLNWRMKKSFREVLDEFK